MSRYWGRTILLVAFALIGALLGNVSVATAGTAEDTQQALGVKAKLKIIYSVKDPCDYAPNNEVGLRFKKVRVVFTRTTSAAGVVSWFGLAGQHGWKCNGNTVTRTIQYEGGSPPEYPWAWEELTGWTGHVVWAGEWPVNVQHGWLSTWVSDHNTDVTLCSRVYFTFFPECLDGLPDNAAEEGPPQ